MRLNAFDNKYSEERGKSRFTFLDLLVVNFMLNSVQQTELAVRQLKTVVTCKIKHLQKCFRAVDFPRLSRGRKNVVKTFYFTCNHGLKLSHLRVYSYSYFDSILRCNISSDTRTQVGSIQRISGLFLWIRKYEQHTEKTLRQKFLINTPCLNNKHAGFSFLVSASVSVSVFVEQVNAGSLSGSRNGS